MKVMVIAMVIDALGTVPEGLGKLEARGKIDIIHNTAVLKSTKFVLEI